ncbi:MAG: SMODS domain-containing nucleotidyltransferase [Promethearchaeota archaeon]
MPSTVNEAFDEFRRSLEPTESEKENIQTRHSFLRQTFNNKIWNDPRVHSFLSGSYARKTQIRPINDVDIIILFNIEEYWDEFRYNPKALLNFSAEKLRETYPNQKIIIQSHSIGIEFSSQPNVDVIPGFIEDYEEEILLIPDYDYNSFIQTSPTLHKAILSEANKKLGNKLIPLIKMMKCWRNKIKYETKIKFKSFHLEVFLMNILISEFRNYPQGIYQVFSNAGDELEKKCYDPADLSGRLDSYLSYQEKQTLIDIFDNTSEKIEEFLNLKMKGADQDAIKGWREIFGPPFPRPIQTNRNLYKKNLTTKFPSDGKNYTYGDK